VVAQTPVDGADRADEAESAFDVDAYQQGWIALNRAMRADEPWSGFERNVAFLQGRSADGALAMVDVAPLVGLDDPGDGRSAARVDLDFDGDEDLVLTARTGPRVRLLENALANGEDWVGVRLEGVTGNAEALGAVVLFEVEGEAADPAAAPARTLRRSRRAGSGYIAQSSQWLRAPIGRRGPDGERATERTPRARLRVRWPGPGGAVEDFGVVRAGRSYVLREGVGRARIAADLPAPVRLEGAARPYAEEVPDVDRRRAVLPSPVSVPSFVVRGVEGTETRIFGRTPDGPRAPGKNVAMLMFDSRDGAAALGDLADLSGALAEAGAARVALDLAPPAEAGTETVAGREAVVEALRGRGWRGDVLFTADPDARAMLGEVVAWRFDSTPVPALPWTLHFGPAGRLHVVRVGPVRVGDAARDVAALVASDADRLGREAVLRPGRWLRPPGEPDLAQLLGRVERAGLASAARELELARIRLGDGPSDPGGVARRLGQSLLLQDPPDVDAAIEAFERALTVNPEDVVAAQGLAFALQAAERFDDAYEAWTTALALAPDDPRALASRVLSALDAGREAAALADIERLEALGAPAARALGIARSALRRARAEAAESAGGGDGDDGGGGDGGR